MVVAPFFIKPIYNMFEKVSPSHPDKLADRIAGAIVDLAYTKAKNPRIATEVLLGHGECNIQVETSEQIGAEDIEAIVSRIAGEGIETRALIVPQDIHLAANQQHGVKCGDNGIFRGVSVACFESPANRGTAIKQGAEKTFAPYSEQQILTSFAATMYEAFPTDGKYLINRKVYDEDPDYVVYELTCCQSCASTQDILGVYETWEYENFLSKGYYSPIESLCINPLGEWTGGPNTDSGATNRKLGSDMGDGVTGGGLHGKDLSKADVSVNIWCYLESIRTGHEVTASCSIGDETVNGIPYKDIVEQARLYIHTLGGFEKFAMWGLVRPLATTLRVSERGHKLA